MNKMIPSEIIHADGSGNAVIGKNVEIDGNVFTLNKKAWGIFPVRSGNVEEMIDDGFILTSVAPSLHPTLKQLSVTGIWISGSSTKVSINPSTSFVVVDPITKLENGILTIGDGDYENFDARFKAIN